MSGSVDNIDLHVFAGNGDVLCEDGDAALALKVVVVENKLTEILGLTHEIRLVDHSVHERSLAVVDMGDNRYVSYICHSNQLKSARRYDNSA